MTDVIVAVDGMGGDVGPEVVLAGLDIARQSHKDVTFAVFGQENIVCPLLSEYPILSAQVNFTHCAVSIGMDEKPVSALRQGRRVSSMWCAIDSVHRNTAHVAISAGNTGALMAMAKVILRTLSGIERPAIAGMWPNLHGKSVVLDLGATVGGTVSQFAQFAVMGSAYARNILGISNPRVAILNIGVEDVKGTDHVRDAASILAASDMNFIGFIEGDGIGQGVADVIVTDGFTGNIALKTAEGTARQMSEYLRQALSRSLMSKIGYLFARRGFLELRSRMDPSVFNGGMFLGLNGSVIKSHGGTSPEGFAYAVDVAIDAARSNITNHIRADVKSMQNFLDTAWTETLG